MTMSGWSTAVATMRRRPRGTRVAAWNTKNAGKRRLRRYIKRCIRRGCIAITLTEVWRQHPALRKIARDLNLTMIAEEPGNRNGAYVSEHGDTVMLLAPGFKVHDVEWIVLGMKWLVRSANRWHEPRRIPRVVGTYDGQRYELLGPHGPTGGNLEAVAEFESTVERVLTKTRDDTTSAAFGDMNIRLDRARGWAGANGLHTSGHGPDLIFANADTTSKRGKTKRGSDHYPMEHEINKEKS